MLAFNLGPAGIRRSDVVKMLNNPAAITGFATLEAAWKQYNKSRKKFNQGLVNRRACEWRVFTDAMYARW